MGRHGPGGLAIQSNVFLQQIIQCFALGNGEGAKLLFVFNFFLAPLRLGSGLVSFPFLFALAVFIGVLIYDTEPVAALYK